MSFPQIGQLFSMPTQRENRCLTVGIFCGLLYLGAGGKGMC